MLVLVYITLAAIGIYLYLRSDRKKGREVPGPRGWPIVGIGFELTSENIYHKYAQYAKTYGDIFKVNVFGTSIVILNSAELTRKAFGTSPYKRNMNDRAKTVYGEHFLFGSQSIAFITKAHGSKHGEMRRTFVKAMHVYGEGRDDFEKLVQTELTSVIKKIASYGSETFNLPKLIKHSIENIIAMMLSGKSLKTDDDFKMIWDYNDAGIFFAHPKHDSIMRLFPFLMYIPSVYREYYLRMEKASAAIIKKYYTDAKATYKKGVVRGMVDAMIAEQFQAQESGGGNACTDEQLMAMTLETVLAGVMTTFSNLSSIFLCLVNHPEYQAKIQAELDRIIGRDRLPTLADKARCPMVEAFVLEVHRYINVVPGLLPHLCNEHMEFEGFDIPKNSLILINTVYIHHDERIWGDPWTFRPERFLDENGEVVPNEHPYRKSWLPFGTGRRQCIGESLARSRVFLFMTALLQRWTFELPPGTRAPCDIRVGDFAWDTTIVRPKSFYCRAVPRNFTDAK